MDAACVVGAKHLARLQSAACSLRVACDYLACPHDISVISRVRPRVLSRCRRARQTPSNQQTSAPKTRDRKTLSVCLNPKRINQPCLSPGARTVSRDGSYAYKGMRRGLPEPQQPCFIRILALPLDLHIPIIANHCRWRAWPPSPVRCSASSPLNARLDFGLSVALGCN